MDSLNRNRISLLCGVFLLALLAGLLFLPSFSNSPAWIGFQDEKETSKEDLPAETLTEKEKKKIREELKKKKKSYGDKLPDSFRFTIELPYLVISNLTTRKHDRITEGTILSAHEAFYKKLMRKKPKDAITVFLFKERFSYRKWAKKLFGDRNVSEFGYYKPGERALVMNINTGTGTLVHEMTHALMDYDFPDAPAWFNEGMGSLYEQCRIVEDGLLGLVNWRLTGLKEAIRKDHLVDLDRVLSTSRNEFYGRNSGVHYAEARYLLLYLQENDQLDTFYRDFRKNHRKDPTGKETLQKITGLPLKKLQKKWIEWVKKLR